MMVISIRLYLLLIRKIVVQKVVPIDKNVISSSVYILLLYFTV